ncbi:MAG: Tail collar domain-containing protein [Halothiobacillaceae bacterium]|nr:MAG: Tail collar domain-containing protein [Halothiobacillaceae bacterium]
MDVFLGQLLLVPYNFAPQGWAFCNGQLLPIAQNTALFSLLGTTYGGNGQTTFALPDLRGRVPLSSGQGPGLSNYALGEVGGAENITLLAAQMPQHGHSVQANSGDPTDTTPTNNVPAGGSTGSYNAAANSVMAAGMIGAAGGSQPHENRPPYLTLNWIIALEGIYPSRS